MKVQDLKNTDGFMGKMTGDVSDPFCVFYVKDLRANSGVASAKKQASTAVVVLQACLLFLCDA
jgi:hypothetical protein